MSIQTAVNHPPSAPSALMQRRVLARVEDALTRRFDGAVPAETIRATVSAVAAELKADARMTTYLPALTEHEARRRLAALVQAPVAVDAPQLLAA